MDLAEPITSQSGGVNGAVARGRGLCRSVRTATQSSARPLAPSEIPAHPLGELFGTNPGDTWTEEVHLTRAAWLRDPAKQAQSWPDRAEQIPRLRPFERPALK